MAIGVSDYFDFACIYHVTRRTVWDASRCQEVQKVVRYTVMERRENHSILLATSALDCRSSASRSRLFESSWLIDSSLSSACGWGVKSTQKQKQIKTTLLRPTGKTNVRVSRRRKKTKAAGVPFGTGVPTGASALSSRVRSSL